ncbi:uncharacterized protein LOC126816704 [Patella vulgata]|uniref:uncharacterized protein LOC126816704 n=1 Tax=Patella vulgata TaxID=6465 RepID=UPI0024A7FED5|nr:uncharacterized protein LOC126816704 [Patella vulgata]XP_050399405.2 uncharacterized protein LOC126816704 [Patella vulgata]
MTFHPCQVLYIVLLVAVPVSESLITEGPLPLPLKECYERHYSKPLSQVVGKTLCWMCEAPVLRKTEGVVKQLLPAQKAYIDGLYNSVENHHRGKRQAPRCLRKEYRRLTDDERSAFHQAVNALKYDTSVTPNRYDAIASLHTGTASLVAHGGPLFPSWHRIYLLMFERALQEKVPGVCLPYIDNTIESEVDVNEISHLFSEDFAGTANGVVTSGPFANWTTPVGPLTRNVGNQAVPMSKLQLDGIMSRNSMEEINEPSENAEFSLEFNHGAFHIFIGGHMENLDRASFDPLFFLHHCYIDKVWQLFREKLRSIGVDPNIYPEMSNTPSLQIANALLGFGNVTASESYSDIFELYDYEPAPECSQINPSCGSTKYLQCNTDTWRCVPVDPNTVTGPINPGPVSPGPINPGPVSPGPVNPGPINHGQNCSKRDKKRFIRSPKSCQNTFCIDSKCDINQWIYIPVKIITTRPPEFKGSLSFPVKNGHVETGEDIYGLSAYTNVNQYVKPRLVEPKGYGNCEDTQGIGQIFISSQGINYEGYYSESSIVDQRLATSMSIAYMAVKNMGRTGKTTALLRAFDQCGRICHTACKVPGSNPAKYRPCSGVVNITPDLPKQYGTSYGEALLDVWGYRNDRECPTFDTDDFFISFYCDYKDRLPWVKELPKPVPPPAPLPIVTQGCQVSPGCTVDIACENKRCKKYGARFPCMDDCSQYALCVYGQFRSRSCPRGMIYSSTRNTCVIGTCSNTKVIGGRDQMFSMFNTPILG